jgi:hypothetical protein
LLTTTPLLLCTPMMCSFFWGIYEQVSKEKVRHDEYRNAAERAEGLLTQLKQQSDSVRGTVDGLEARKESESRDLEGLRVAAAQAVQESEQELSSVLSAKALAEEQLATMRREALEAEKARSAWQRSDEVRACVRFGISVFCFLFFS